MSAPQFAYLYLLTVPIFFLIDGLWLGILAKGFYQNKLMDFLAPINWTAAIIFYLIFIIGIIIFAVAPALEAKSALRALLLGALFGFFTYATYDLTNLATLKNWPISVVLVDIVWGTILSGSVALISFFIGRSLFY